MDKDTLELKMKIIELKLERDKTVNSFLIGVLAAIIFFFVTSSFIVEPALKLMSTYLTNSMITQDWILAIFLITVYMILLPILAGFFTKWIIDAILSAQNKAYNDRIQDLEKLIIEKGLKTR